MRHFFSLMLMLVIAFAVAAQNETSITAQDLADENGQFADVDGVEIYYVEAGDRDNPAVILIHGFGGSSFTWRDNMDAIADAGYYVVALDLPPFGLSDKSPDISHTRTAYADYVAGLMDTLEIESATFVGHSMGGGTTAYFAVNYPERVDNLVFVAGGLFDSDAEFADADGDTTSPFGAFASLDLDAESMVPIIENSLIPATFAAILETAYFDPETMTDDAVDGYARPILIEGWAEGFVAYWLTEEDNPLSLDDLIMAIDVPVLIMWGEEDTWVPIDMGIRMNDAIQDSTLVTYSKTGHLPMEEMIETFNADLIAFLDGNR